MDDKRELPFWKIYELWSKKLVTNKEFDKVLRMLRSEDHELKALGNSLANELFTKNKENVGRRSNT